MNSVTGLNWQLWVVGAVTRFSAGTTAGPIGSSSTELASFVGTLALLVCADRVFLKGFHMA